MTKRVGVLVAVAGMLLLAAGCVVPWPHKRVHAPAREGRVIAADDGSPVAGAVVTSLENGRLRLPRSSRSKAFWRLPPMCSATASSAYCCIL